MKQLCEEYEMQLIIGQVSGIEEPRKASCRELRVTGADGVTRRVPLDMLLVFYGLSPKAGPDRRVGPGYRAQAAEGDVSTEKFETNVPGIFAVGDINTYPGKKKLILSGFHEAALAAFGAAPYIFPDKKIHMQYTTTSPKLHKVLGVESPSCLTDLTQLQTRPTQKQRKRCFFCFH
jgi:thioredoxin reductase (NADPH)